MVIVTTRVAVPAQSSRPRPSAVLDAVLERLTYVNEETGYTVARVATERGSELLTVVGALMGAQPGESLRLAGRWSSHPKFGRQFEVESFTTVLPATIQGIQRYLGSGLVKGIGPVFAERIVEHFALDTLRIIEEEPSRLIEVPGLGPKRTTKITAAWAEQKSIKEVMIFLQGVGVSTSLAVRIYKKYGDAAIAVVKNEPYRLAADVWGIGFKTADTIAQAVGIAPDSPARVKAGIQFTLSEASDNGHCYLPQEELVPAAMKILNVTPRLVIDCLDELVTEEGVVRHDLPAGVAGGDTAGATERATGATEGAAEGGGDGEHPIRAVYLVPFHRAETSLANTLLRLLRHDGDRMPHFHQVDWAKALSWLHGRTGHDLAPEQELAVRLALTAKVAVLTGGPGCGKSFTVASIVALASAKKAKVTLVAPTGRAAKRLSELTGHPAATVHRLLALRPGGEATYDRDNPLDVDLLVVDEASMLDVILANKLVKAIPPGAHLLFVGDVDQLPSVGAGEVLRDLLAAATIPRVRLTQVFRQAAQSGVITNAHRINAGRPPVVTGLPDFFLFACDEAEVAATTTVDVACTRVPTRFGLDPRRDIQILTPMHRGPAGAGALNTLLQERLTPHRDSVPERRVGGRVFRVGDKVTQIRNNYGKGQAGVFNGTLGIVTAISAEDQSLRVHTDEDEPIDYDFDELDELAHAYAITIHRSQGSEYPAVVIPLTTSAWMMLQRNLLYTAVTRAKKLVVLVGSKRALAAAVRTVGAGRRHTALAHRIGG